MSATASPQPATLLRRMALTLLLAATSCAMPTAGAPAAPARHGPAYDSQIDTAATSLQSEMDGFLTNIATDPNFTYERFKSWYSDYELKLRSLLVRTRAHADDDATTQQVEAVLRNVETLRSAHEAGPLSLEAAETFRVQFNAGWQAVLALELAKPHDGG